MSNNCLADRLKRLRDLRSKLCNKEKNWQEAFKARDWIVDQLKILRDMADADSVTKQCIKDRLEDILCVFEPDAESDNNDS
jgi:uncharacterized protein (DUF2342 family)